MRFPQRLVMQVALLGLTIGRPAAHATWTHLGRVTDVQADAARVTVRCGDAAVQLTAMDDHVVRVRLAPEGEFGRDFSWAIQDLAPKGRFSLEDVGGDAIRLSTGSLRVSIHRDPCRLEVRDGDGHLLVADEVEWGMAWGESASGGGRPVRVWHHLPDGAAIYGLGEKVGGLNKRDRAWTMWNTDAAAYGTQTDPLYKSIPFFISEVDGRYHGVFLDNPWRTTFDFGQTDRGVTSFGAEGGELNYYVIAGPDPKDVIKRYTRLAGRIELPPKWAIGYHQSRYGYYPDSLVRRIASDFRVKNIPCDVIHLDIDYMDGHRCFTWDDRWFPDPKKLTDDLKRLGIRTIVIVDPGIKNEAGYAVFDSGDRIHAWLTKPDGEPYVGRVWPGPCVFPDFTNADVRRWWADLFPEFVRGAGIDGVWNDMNEPADFAGPNKTVPLDVRFDNQGEPVSHRACHNVYGMQMVRATREGLKRAWPGRRPFTLTRATYAGGQRFGAGWTGDNTSSWAHLALSVPMVLNLGVSGMPFVGPDIGGFVGGATPELFARWIQVGSLMPFCRTHTSCYNPRQEPWSYGVEVETIARHALMLRYSLMPYLYSLFEESSRTGLPIVRPLWLEFPGLRTWAENRRFMLGPDLLVMPVLEPGIEEMQVDLPPDAWFDHRTELIHGDWQAVRMPIDLTVLPMFVRAGAIIPMQSPVLSTMEPPAEPLILDIWPFGESEASLYEDDGESLDYQAGAWRRTRFTCSATDGRVVFTMHAPQGDYVPPERSPLLCIHGLSGPVQHVTCAVGDNLPEGDLRTTPIDPGGAGSRKITRTLPLEKGPLDKPAQFRQTGRDEARPWLVRMYPDEGKPQRVQIEYDVTRYPWGKRLNMTFDPKEDPIEVHRHFRPPQYDNGTVRFHVRHADNPSFVLPRLRLSADALPILKVKMTVEQASKVHIKFATEQNPRRSSRPGVTFDLTPDGKIHEYTFDMSQAAPADWTGTVYWLEFSFPENVLKGETISLHSVTFDRSS